MVKEQNSNKEQSNGRSGKSAKPFNEPKKNRNFRNNKPVFTDDDIDPAAAAKRKNRYSKFNRNRGRKLPADADLKPELKLEDKNFSDKSFGDKKLRDNEERMNQPFKKERGGRNFRNQRFGNYDKKNGETIEDIKLDIVRIEKEIKLALAELKSTDVSL